MENEILNLTNIENLLSTQVELLKGIYSVGLFVIGTVSAIFVLVLLYKFIKSCY